ncbi:ABC transporter permease, partial [Gordonibacter sp.]|uniref:ABC transporter permease n=1 Tax=Gordonibacter sp. TaxID=1968902 RepID=UPI002FC82206
MSSVFAIARRIFSQFIHDKRTLALLFVAPIVVLWLLSVLLGADAYQPRIATVDLPASFQSSLDAQDAHISDVDAAEAERLLRADKVDAVLRMAGDGETLDIWAEGSDSTKTAAVAGTVAKALSDAQQSAADEMKADAADKQAEAERLQTEAAEKQAELATAVKSLTATLPDSVRAQLPTELADLAASSQENPLDATDFSLDMKDYLPVQSMQTTYLHGDESWTMLDFYGPVFIGVFLLVFVFITSGMSLVNEKSAGTMQRFLSTPVKPIQILGGYTLGFGTLALVQAAVILWAGLALIGFPCEGNIGLVLLAAVSFALVSVTLGLLVSGLASNAFQVIQLMLLFVVPQILLSGLFDLSSSPEWLQWLSHCIPTSYGVDALRAIMLRGAGWAEAGPNIAAMWGFIVWFFALA